MLRPTAAASPALRARCIDSAVALPIHSASVYNAVCTDRRLQCGPLPFSGQVAKTRSRRSLADRQIVYAAPPKSSSAPPASSGMSGAAQSSTPDASRAFLELGVDPLFMVRR